MIVVVALFVVLADAIVVVALFVVLADVIVVVALFVVLADVIVVAYFVAVDDVLLSHVVVADLVSPDTVLHIPTISLSHIAFLPVYTMVVAAAVVFCYDCQIAADHALVAVGDLNLLVV